MRHIPATAHARRPESLPPYMNARFIMTDDAFIRKRAGAGGVAVSISLDDEIFIWVLAG